MKVIVVGASGRIGSKVAGVLSPKHEVVRVGAHTGDVLCDYTDPASVRGMFERIGAFDALVAVVRARSRERSTRFRR